MLFLVTYMLSLLTDMLPLVTYMLSFVIGMLSLEEKRSQVTPEHIYLIISALNEN
ncbi:MAG: hypothetical protein IJ604_00325 [Prevotella sp.]|nr:hypothetical protein [Prevotella sp.]